MRTGNLNAAQLWLVLLMHENQFGSVENLRIKAGLPVPDSSVRVIRSSRLGGGPDGRAAPSRSDFELKRAIADLFDELARLQDDSRVRIEFRRGLPCLIETEKAAV